MSQWSDVLSVITQGLILGPVLFIIYINDLIESCGEDAKIYLLADDVRLYNHMKWSRGAYYTQLCITVEILRYFTIVHVFKEAVYLCFHYRATGDMCDPCFWASMINVNYSRVLHSICNLALNLQQSTTIISFLLAAIVYHVYFYNVREHLGTTPFTYFQHPLAIDIQSVVAGTLNNHPPSIQPLNNKRSFPYVLNADKRCKDDDGNEEPVYLIILIKSQLENVDQRRMIRRTWGREFGITSVPVRRVFLLGVHAADKKLQHRIGLEQQVSNRYDKEQTNLASSRVIVACLYSAGDNIRFACFVDHHLPFPWRGHGPPCKTVIGPHKWF